MRTKEAEGAVQDLIADLVSLEEEYRIRKRAAKALYSDDPIGFNEAHDGMHKEIKIRELQAQRYLSIFLFGKIKKRRTVLTEFEISNRELLLRDLSNLRIEIKHVGGRRKIEIRKEIDDIKYRIKYMDGKIVKSLEQSYERIIKYPTMFR